MKRSVFFVSDRTAITAEVLGRGLLTQFPDCDFTTVHLPFVDDRAKAEAVARRIREAARLDGSPPLVFATFVDPALQQAIAEGSGAHVFELFNSFLGPLEQALGTAARRIAGRMHGMGDPVHYERRMDAIQFTLAHDDGVKVDDLDQADVVLLGVSRCGKTPTCLYLAIQYNLHAANYPLTEDDLAQVHLPRCLEAARGSLFGLSIAAERLSRIRRQRRGDTPYASLEQCRWEVEAAEALFRREGIAYLETTAVSVEEIATTIRQRVQRSAHGPAVRKEPREQ